MVVAGEGSGRWVENIVTKDSDTNAMASVVDRVKTLVVYIDHDESFRGIDWDDVVVNPSAEWRLEMIYIYPLRTIRDDIYGLHLSSQNKWR